MAEEINYTVSSHDGTGWRDQGTSRNMQTALSAAEKLFASNKFEQVKVDKAFKEAGTQRQVRTTIFSKTRAERKGVPGWLWILIALAAGLVSFIITLAVLEG